MGKKIKEVDAYITKSQEFAKPILTKIRDVVHKTCPDVEEAIKWGMPFFMYNGQMMCMMSAFKQHAAMGFYKAALMSDKTLIENAKSESAMGHVGRMESINDLPSDKKLAAWIKEAMKLNAERVKLPKAKPSPKEKKELVVPDYVTKALRTNKTAKAAFEAFPYSHKKEYVTWFEEAKTDATREKRLAQAIEWMAEGKSRNWKYERKK
ncbi:MAG: YdeI/OmpD-associated family protein [Bacteroidetes bacterium]|nr:YdeI/OmpD-associated family protein [Bacteroidota bacterium]